MTIEQRGLAEQVTISQYEAVAARRTAFDALVWQVPLITLTAQAFLLVVSVGPGSAPWARAAAATLGLLVSGLSMALMARHRQAEESDAKWLQRFEERILGEGNAVHGLAFKKMRDEIRLRVPGGRLGPLGEQYRAWMWGLSAFAIVSVAALVHAIWLIVAQI